jgi:hypothetical protein
MNHKYQHSLIFAMSRHKRTWLVTYIITVCYTDEHILLRLLIAQTCAFPSKTMYACGDLTTVMVSQCAMRVSYTVVQVFSCVFVLFGSTKTVENNNIKNMEAVRTLTLKTV